MQLGWGHRNTALAEYALMAGCGSGALWALGQLTTVRIAMFVGAALVYLVLAALVDMAGDGIRKEVKTVPTQVNWRNVIAFLHDLGAAALAWLLGYLFRFNFEIEEPYVSAMLPS